MSLSSRHVLICSTTVSSADCTTPCSECRSARGAHAAFTDQVVPIVAPPMVATLNSACILMRSPVAAYCGSTSKVAT